MALLKNILCICTETHTGMRDFAIPLIKAAEQNYEVYKLFVINPNKPCRIEDMIDNHNLTIVSQPSSKVAKVIFRIYAFQLKKEIIRICKDNDIHILWLMTGDTLVAPFINSLNKQYKVYYTVHDLFPHEAPYRTLKQKITYRFFFQRHFDKLLRDAKFMVTSSKSQYDYMVAHMKSKKVYYHPFPSLINTSIQPEKCAELEGAKDYILYFSTIGHYKGVDLLYNAFINSQELQQYKLVIAGRGNVYFKRCPEKENNVIMVNRFIKDGEIPQLFKDARAVVLPYRTATQSGNTSYVYYFQKLLLVSDIPYFREVASDGETALFFRCNDENSLQSKLEELMLRTDEQRMKKFQGQAYRELYSEEAIASYIKKIFG